MNAPLKPPVGTPPWSPPRWSERDIEQAAEIFKREVTDKYGEGTRLPKGARSGVISIIAAALKRDFESVSNRHLAYGATFAVRQRVDRRDQRNEPRAPRDMRWSAEEIAEAAEIYQRQVKNLYGDDLPRGLKQRVIHNIAARLDRQFWSVEARLRLQGPTFGEATVQAGHNKHILERVLLDRDARAKARLTMSLTAEKFGDPPPGFSALDRMRQRA